MSGETEKTITHELILRQLGMWKNLQEDLRIQGIVAQSIGDGEERLKLIRDEMARTVKAVEKLESMLKELDA